MSVCPVPLLRAALGGAANPSLVPGCSDEPLLALRKRSSSETIKKKGIKCHEFQAVDSCRAMLRVACLHFDKEWGLFVVSSAV